LQPGNAGQADLFGAVVNLQTGTEGSNVSATIMGHEIGLGMGATTASTLSVSGNASKAEALGNDATNELILAGTSHAAANTLDAANAGYSFMLVNTQILAAASGIVASVSDQRIGVSGDEIEASTVDIFGNSQIAEARGNRAANTVSFGFSLLGEEGRIGDLRTSASLEN